MFKEKFRSPTVVLSSDKKVETEKLKIHFLTSKYAYSFFCRALSHENQFETEVFTLLTNSDVLRLRMKGQNIESAQPLPPQPLMVRFLWLLLKEGKHLKGV